MKEWTYYSTIDETEMPQLIITQVDVEELPPGVPHFPTKEGLLRFLQEQSDERRRLVNDIEEWYDGEQEEN